MRRATIALALLVIAGVAALALVRGYGISAVTYRPIPFEAQTAKAVWRFLVPANVRTAANPVPPTADVLKEAREHWADHCATCHANDGSGDATIGRRVFPRAPDMRVAPTQALTDGELFYAIEQGIPWTAMPGWRTGEAEGERASWALVRFIRHLPSITPDEVREMEALNPQAPVNHQHEQEIDDFLKGGAPAPTPSPGRGRGGD